jgi:hypothetical protein
VRNRMKKVVFKAEDIHKNVLYERKRLLNERFEMTEENIERLKAIDGKLSQLTEEGYREAARQLNVLILRSRRNEEELFMDKFHIAVLLNFEREMAYDLYDFNDPELFVYREQLYTAETITDRSSVTETHFLDQVCPEYCDSCRLLGHVCRAMRYFIDGSVLSYCDLLRMDEVSMHVQVWYSGTAKLK